MMVSTTPGTGTGTSPTRQQQRRRSATRTTTTAVSIATLVALALVSTTTTTTRFRRSNGGGIGIALPEGTKGIKRDRDKGGGGGAYRNISFPSSLQHRPTTTALNTTTTATTVNTVITDDWIRDCVRTFPREEVRPFPVPSGFESYRIGDCLKKCRGCSNRSQVEPNRAPANSVAYEFETLACPANFTVVRKPLDLELISQILRRRGGDGDGNGSSDWKDPTFVKPDQDELVVHLRLGDQIEGSEADVEQMLRDGADPKGTGWANTIKSVYEILDAVEKSKSRKVSIVGGSHFPHQYEKSRVYAGCVKRAIQRHQQQVGGGDEGYNVTMRIDGNDAGK